VSVAIEAHGPNQIRPKRSDDDRLRRTPKLLPNWLCRGEEVVPGDDANARGESSSASRRSFTNSSTSPYRSSRIIQQDGASEHRRLQVGFSKTLTWLCLSQSIVIVHCLYLKIRLNLCYTDKKLFKPRRFQLRSLQLLLLRTLAETDGLKAGAFG
jgi:hypothetical protein